MVFYKMRLWLALGTGQKRQLQRLGGEEWRRSAAPLLEAAVSSRTRSPALMRHNTRWTARYEPRAR
jgi:hypothetical protein